MKKALCTECGGILCNDDVSFNLRVRGLGIGSFYCLPCLALQWGCQVSFLENKLKLLKDGECSFFKRNYVDEQTGGTS